MGWFSGFPVKDKNNLNQTVKVCSINSWNAAVRLELPLEEPGAPESPKLYLTTCFRCPSGRHYRAPPRKINRYSNSFIPSDIKLSNAAESSNLWANGLCKLLEQ